MREIMRAGVKKIVFAGLGLAVALGGFGGTLGSVKAAGEQGRNPYPYGKSTYWAWQNRPDLPANLGEAKDWDNNARGQGWPMSEYPRRGDIAVLEPGVQAVDARVGQVAFVEQVLQDGSYVATQMEDTSCVGNSTECGKVNRRVYTIVAGSSFIHYKKDTRTTWGFASGQSGWTATDLQAGNYGGPGWFYPLAGTNPRLVSPELDLPLDLTYNTVEVEMVTGIPVSDPTVQIYFATEARPEFVEANSVKVKGVGDGELHRYSFYFGDNPAWKGKLVGLRLDPAGAGTTGGVRVDRVRLVQAEPQSQPYTTLSDPTTGGDHGGRRR
jgi:surface antigen